MIKAFLSHSSIDKKSYVDIVASRLTKANIVYDALTFEEGEKSFDEIIRGLNESNLFVLFISEPALSSSWVMKEIEIAKKYFLDKKNKRIYPVIIDRSITHEDKRIPNWLKDEYNLRYLSRPSVLARRIELRLREISWQIHPELEKRKKIFVGRNEKIEEFEIRIDDFDRLNPKCVIATGLNSVGRRTFLKHAFIKSNLIKNSYNPLELYLNSNDSIEDFILKLNDFAIMNINDQIKDMINKTLYQKIGIAARLIESIQKAKEKIMIVDEGCIVNYKREISKWFLDIIKKDYIQNVPTICCASKYKTNYIRFIQENIFSINVPELTVSERNRLFKKLLEFYKIDLTKENFKLFANQFHGFPEEIMFGVDLIKRLYVDGAIKEIYQITEYNNEKAALLLKKYEDEDELFFIRLLANSEIISRSFLFEIVDSNEYSKLLETLITENICEYFGGDNEFIRLNDSIRDYISRNEFPLKEEHKRRLKKHVSDFLSSSDQFDRDSSDFIYSLKEALVGDKVINEELLIPSHFLRCMKELYYKKHLTKVIKLADKVLEKEANIDKLLVNDIRYYLCLALARKKDRRVLNEVQKIIGDEHNFILGYYYRIVGRHSDALNRLSSVADAKYVKTRARRELVQVFLQIEEYDKALEFAQQNYENKRGNQFNILTYFNCIINSEHYYKKKSILSSLCDELDEIGSSQAHEMFLRSKAFYEAKCNNDEDKAMSIINDAIYTYPEIQYPLLTKFDIALRFRNIEVMKEANEELRILKSNSSISEQTFMKQLAFIEAIQGNVHKAKQILDKVLRNFTESSKARMLEKLEQLARNL